MSRPFIGLLVSMSAMALQPGCARQTILDAPITSARAPVVLDCPLGVPHTHLDVVETASGADVVFVTTNQQVVELRARARFQAEVHGPGGQQGGGHVGQHRLGHDHGLRLFELPPRVVDIVDAPEGAVMHIAAVDPARRQELVAQLTARVARLNGRSCPW